MPIHPDQYVPLIYMLAALPYVWLGLYAWRKRPAVAVTPFAWTMVGLSIWASAYSLEIFSSVLNTKLFFINVEYIGIVCVPVYLLFFALEFTGKGYLLTLRTKLMIWALPLLTLLLVWTNPYHHLMWNVERIMDSGGLKLLDLRFGLFFWINAIFSYALLMTACLLLVMELIQRPGFHRIQISLVVLAILFPLAGKFLFIMKINPIKNLDVTPLFFLPTAIGLYLAIIKYRLLDVIPLEHLVVLKNMQDGIIVLDQYQRVRYINPTVEGLLNQTENDVIGQPLAHISGQLGKKLSPYLSGTEYRAEIRSGEGKQAKIYEVTVSPVANQNFFQDKSISDNIIILHDITERKEAELVLSRRESIMSAIGLASEQFLRGSSWEQNIPAVLEKIGRAADVSRVSVAMNYTNENKVVFSSICYEWAAPGVISQINKPVFQHIPLRESGLGRWETSLSQGNPIFGAVDEFPESERVIFQSSESISIAAIPIFTDTKWWGFIIFDECRDKRQWTSTELEALHITARIFGSAETRARTEQKLIRRQRMLDLLHDIVGISLQGDDINDMAQTVVDRLGELIKADGCFLSLWDETNQRTIPLAAYGMLRDQYTSLSPQPGERTFTETVLKLGHTLVIDDTRTTSHADPRIVQNFPSISVLALPLITKNHKLGSVLLTFNKLHHFQPEEISIGEQAAALIALALEKFQAMEHAQKRANTSETLRKAGTAISEKLEMEETVSHILEQLNQVVPYTSASVQMLDNNELHIIGGRGWEKLSDVVGMRFPISGDNPNSVVMKTGKPYHLPEIWKVHEKFNEPPHNHIRSWLGVPLIFKEKIIGLLAIDSSEPNHFKEDDINTASEFANQVAIALENARIFQETQNQAITDLLTGLYNRRGLFQLGEFEFMRARRINRPFSALIFDIDHFKKINDQYGHAAGDQILQKLAERCTHNSRAIDLIGRYGGEEFVILLPDTTLDAAQLVAERLRLSIMNEIFSTDTAQLNVTISVGAAETNALDTLSTLIERADAALYKAKRTGRNRVVLNDNPQPPRQI